MIRSQERIESGQRKLCVRLSGLQQCEKGGCGHQHWILI